MLLPCLSEFSSIEHGNDTRMNLVQFPHSSRSLSHSNRWKTRKLKVEKERLTKNVWNKLFVYKIIASRLCFCDAMMHVLKDSVILK